MSSSGSNNKNNAIKDLFKHLDRGFSARTLSLKRPPVNRNRDLSSPPSLDHHHHLAVDAADSLGDSAPPEWALLLIGCLLGVSSGLLVAVFNKGVHLCRKLVLESNTPVIFLGTCCIHADFFVKFLSQFFSFGFD